MGNFARREKNPSCQGWGFKCINGIKGREDKRANKKYETNWYAEKNINKVFNTNGWRSETWKERYKGINARVNFRTVMCGSGVAKNCVKDSASVKLLPDLKAPRGGGAILFISKCKKGTTTSRHRFNHHHTISQSVKAASWPHRSWRGKRNPTNWISGVGPK